MASTARAAAAGAIPDRSSPRSRASSSTLRNVPSQLSYARVVSCRLSGVACAAPNNSRSSTLRKRSSRSNAPQYGVKRPRSRSSGGAGSRQLRQQWTHHLVSLTAQHGVIDVGLAREVVVQGAACDPRPRSD